MAEYNGVNMKGKNIKWWAFLFAPSIFLMLVIGIPFLYVAVNFFSLNEMSAFFGTGTLSVLSRQAFINSFAQGIDSAVLSLLIGFPLGLFIGRYAGISSEDETFPKSSPYALTFKLEFQPISTEEINIEVKTANSKIMKRVV